MTDQSEADIILRFMLVSLADGELEAAILHFGELVNRIKNGERVTIRGKDRETIGRAGERVSDIAGQEFTRMVGGTYSAPLITGDGS